MKRKHPSIDPEYRYSIKEICYLLDICRDTIRKYTNKGVIVPIVITSREVYYIGSEVKILYNALTARKNDNHAYDR